MWGWDSEIQFACGFSGGIKEGDIADITITKDVVATDETNERVMSLIEKLNGKGSEGVWIKTRRIFSLIP